MIQTVDVALGARSYPIAIGRGALDRLPEILAARAPGARVAMVTDETVAALHGERVMALLGPSAPPPLLLPPGEASKSLATLERVLEGLLALELTRRDLVLALGGGVVGDLAGFAAAICKRGIPFVQVPTTLLAMVDSAVGGKTAINMAAGKNLVGAFHQPVAVVSDLALLDTLPTREWRAGYAEIAKYGVLGDRAFFAWLEAHGAAVLAGEPAALAHAIATSCAAKAAIVAEDEQETGDRRALLNLGHTFGHALEAETGFSSRLLHGEAVAAGMALAAGFSAARGLSTRADAARVGAHLAAHGLPTSLADCGIDRAAAPRLVAHMAQDKKREGQTLPFILLRGIGAAFVDRTVDPADVEAFLATA